MRTTVWILVILIPLYIVTLAVVEKFGDVWVIPMTAAAVPSAFGYGLFARRVRRQP